MAEGDPIPSESELAAEWSVSKMTVHRAMTELQEQGLVARKRRTGTIVTNQRQEAPASQGRRLSGQAGQDRNRQTTSLALIIDDQRDRLALQYIRGVSTAIPETHTLLFFNSQGSIEREAECLRQARGQVAGIVLFPATGQENLPLIREIVAEGTPIVGLDRDIDCEGVSSVASDNYGASLSGLRYLTGRGHTRIAYFTWGLRDDPEVAPVLDRYNAWHTVMAENGFADPSRWLRRYPQHISADFEHLTQFANDALFAMLHQPEPPTAVFCVNDYFLIALLQACRDLEIAVPGQLEMLSFNDGIQLMPRQERSVHRLVQRMEAMGQRAVELLLARIADPGLPAEHVRMPADFHPAKIGP